MAIRLRDHPLDQGAIGALGIVSTGELGLGVAKPQRERVANSLQLAGAKQTRPADGTDPPLEPRAGGGLAEQGAEPALDPGYLAAQVRARLAFRRLADPGD